MQTQLKIAVIGSGVAGLSEALAALKQLRGFAPAANAPFPSEMKPARKGSA